MKTPRMLLVKASSDICAAEICHIQSICEMFGIEHRVVELKDLDGFCELVGSLGKFDYLYLGAHADTAGFGEADGSVGYDWESFAAVLCSTDCLRYGSVLMLGCCRGGLRMVALQLFYACAKIDYVTGPRWTVTSQDITTGFHIFLYNMACRKEQPSTAATRASAGTGYDFYYYDRVEAEDAMYSRLMEDRIRRDLALPAENGSTVDDAT